MNPADYQPKDYQWSQRDKRWAKKTLGNSGLTVGGYGCATLCCTYLIDRRRQKMGLGFLYPNQVVDRAVYTSQGNIYWNVVSALTNGQCQHTYNDAEARHVFVQVEWVAHSEFPTHWVVKLGTDADNLCYNPLSGRIEPMKQPVWRPTGRKIYYKIV